MEEEEKHVMNERWQQGNKWAFTAANCREEEKLRTHSYSPSHTLRASLTLHALVISMSSTTALTDLGQALCIVTGASRGLGRTVAKHLARLIKPGSAIVLTARSGQDLRSLQTELTGGDGAGAGLVVECVEADLGHNDAPGRIVSAARRCFKADMDHVILVNNAGKKNTPRPGEVDLYCDLYMPLIKD